MNYLPRNRSRSSLKKPILFVIGVFLFGILVHFLLGGVVVAAISPLWKGENFAAAKLSYLGEFFRTKNSLIAENESLKSRIEALEIERASRFSMPIEGESLAALLGRRQETGGVIASTLAKPPQTPYDTIVIDAGTDEGLALGQSVLLPSGPMLGMVTETYASSAKVKLFSAPQEKTAAVLERHGVPITLEGVGGGNFKVVLPRETEVEVGDRILSADVFSALLAVVGEVQMEPTDSFKDVYASSPLNIFNIHLVLVRP